MPLINCCLRTGKFPIKNDKDKKDKNVIDSYRPINNLSVLKKNIELHIRFYLLKFLSVNVIDNAHYCGHKGHSTTTAPLDIYIMLLTNKQKDNVTVITDRLAAFDNANISILLWKLEHYDMDTQDKVDDNTNSEDKTTHREAIKVYENVKDTTNNLTIKSVKISKKPRNLIVNLKTKNEMKIKIKPQDLKWTISQYLKTDIRPLLIDDKRNQQLYDVIVSPKRNSNVLPNIPYSIYVTDEDNTPEDSVESIVL